MLSLLDTIGKRTPPRRRRLWLLGSNDRAVAAAVGVTTASVRGWRRHRHAPQPRHEERLRALEAVVHAARDD